jgi:hypothetical protein
MCAFCIKHSIVHLTANIKVVDLVSQSDSVSVSIIVNEASISMIFSSIQFLCEFSFTTTEYQMAPTNHLSFYYDNDFRGGCCLPYPSC